LWGPGAVDLGWLPTTPRLPAPPIGRLWRLGGAGEPLPQGSAVCGCPGQLAIDPNPSYS